MSMSLREHATTSYQTWAYEWKQYLARRSSEKEPIMAQHPSYAALKQKCTARHLICTPDIYQEYLQWTGSLEDFMAASTAVQGQLEEYRAAYHLEAHAKRHRITFYALSIQERISLASRFMDE